ncbi:aminodeoxychorismate lyase [Psychromonas sp. RZ22]|uniref:aminodeoxychorismate lyase n=1 Tax=Psychromonas algarum TaxID=2555643 RepID=UPI0010671F06|nr:aminodeoxychorismate lyase [Psychromonas sp. RZ22]TEW54360.1 aminodeoxychorismate lyase [Psychromonas sp. RZ22]
MLINGLENNKLCATDRGLAYADGLFSTIKVEFGLIIDWSLHLQRLQLGAARLFFPDVDWLLLEQEVTDYAQTVKEHAHYVLKVILTRGSGGRGYSIENCQTPTRIISLSPFPEIYLQWQKQGIDIIQCESLLSRNKQLAGLKSLARLEQVLIKQELMSKQAVEGLVCDEFDHLIEACAANVFIYLNDQWYTPKLDYCGVAGVMRARILQHALIDVIEKEISLIEVNQASCLFLTNALMGVVPVKQYQGKTYSQQQLQRVTELQAVLNQGRISE